MRCRKCGEELPDNARFCYVCGEPTEEVPAPKRLEEPLDPLAAGAVPLVPVAPPPRAYAPRHRPTRRPAAYGEHRVPVRDVPDPAHDPAPSAETDERAHAAEAERARAEAEELARAVAEGATVSMRAVPEEPEPAEPGSRGPEALSDAPDPSARASAASVTARFARAARERLSSAGRQVSAARRQIVRDEMPGPQDRPPRAVLIVGAAAAALVVLTVLVAVGTSWLNPFAAADPDAPVVQPPSDGSIAPIQEQEEAATEGQSTLPEDAPAARAAVEDYSWEELSKISALIAGAATDDEALDIAAEYNLCDASGALDGTQTKDLELADGTVVAMAVAGFNADERADGEGTAGITFVARSSIGSDYLNPTGEALDWEEMPLRSYLNEGLLAELPEGLAELIVPVTKTTNTVLGSAEETTQTDETVWLPSYTELVGPAGDFPAAGAQYQLYADLGVSYDDTSALGLGGEQYWWTRSPNPENELYYDAIAPDGFAFYGRNPARELSVLIGFSL